MFQIKLLACNILLWLSLIPETVGYLFALAYPARAQKKVLRSILKRMDLSESNFRNCKTSTYEDYSALIGKIRNDGEHPTYKDQVTRLCPTSGSTSQNKLIPYTPSLKQAFQKGMYPWMFFLYLMFPKLFLRRQYWSVTPLFENGNPWPESKVTIGFENDEDYVGAVQRLITKTIWVDTGDIAKGVTSTEIFLAKLANKLKEEKLLGLVSVWSPSLLSLLARKNPDTFPKNLVVSSWAHGFSEAEARNTTKQLNATLQPKGLLSTEACVTIPVGTETFLLAYNSHYFEFREVTGEVLCTPDFLLVGHDYEVIVTTQSGFVRYTTGDVIRVTKKIFGLPSCEFIGRLGIVDLFGEKLDEISVYHLVEEVLDGHDVASLFWLLSPTKTNDGDVAYTLFIKTNTGITDKFVNDVDTCLRKVYHYDLCRNLGQLGHARIFVITNESPEEVFIQKCGESRTARIGDIKILHVHSGFDWHTVFEGKFF